MVRYVYTILIASSLMISQAACGMLNTSTNTPPPMPPVINELIELGQRTSTHTGIPHTQLTHCEISSLATMACEHIPQLIRSSIAAVACEHTSTQLLAAQAAIALATHPHLSHSELFLDIAGGASYALGQLLHNQIDTSSRCKRAMVATALLGTGLGIGKSGSVAHQSTTNAAQALLIYSAYPTVQALIKPIIKQISQPEAPLYGTQAWIDLTPEQRLAYIIEHDPVSPWNILIKPYLAVGGTLAATAATVTGATSGCITQCLSYINSEKMANIIAQSTLYELSYRAANSLLSRWHRNSQS